MKIKEKVDTVLKRLKREHPEAETALEFSDPFQLLAATILSAQTTDAQVNRITVNLFKKYRTIKDYADADPEAFERDVAGVNYYKTKAKNIRGTAALIMEKYKGRVPDKMEELLTLPGVARKTANIVLYSGFGINAGIAVDTHVKRVSARLGLTKNSDPKKIEADLMAATASDEWGNISNLLILHGRSVCKANGPLHDKCVLYDICPSRGI